ncbi:MAG: hypothetical protein F9K30_14985 [Dechloromonas sp.]|nr:MAG: hypothetical protein F9K30_14985 [Dechloromonas sp.]
MKAHYKKLAGVALLGFALPMSAHAVATLQNGYVLAGVSDVGTLGSNSNTPPGILFDKTGTSTYGVNDFLTPGTPFEGFYLTTGNGGAYGNNNSGGSSFAFSLTQNSATSVTAVGTSSDGLFGISHLYSLTTLGGRSVISITTTLTNLGNEAASGLRFLRTLDPDPDVNAFGSYYTENVVLSDSEACGTGTQSGQTICIYTTSGLEHKAGVSSPWSTSPSDYLSGVDDGDGDYAIGLAFALGSLGAGQSLTFDYGYALGASRDDATGRVPEPGSALLVAAGLFGLARTLRGKRAKA